VNRLLADGLDDGVIVLGDLNDGPEAATTQLLYGPTGSQYPSRGFDRRDAGDAQRLFSVAGFIPEERRFSRRHNGVGELIDHILVSEELVPLVGTQRIQPSADTYPGDTFLVSIGDNPNERRNEAVSDHAAVVAWFDI
jgi:endonuclease/exonuclease/phosphatase family metal-dependent hydrolase